MSDLFGNHFVVFSRRRLIYNVKLEYQILHLYSSVNYCIKTLKTMFIILFFFNPSACLLHVFLFHSCNIHRKKDADA